MQTVLAPRAALAAGLPTALLYSDLHVVWWTRSPVSAFEQRAGNPTLVVRRLWLPPLRQAGLQSAIQPSMRCRRTPVPCRALPLDFGAAAHAPAA